MANHNAQIGREASERVGHALTEKEEVSLVLRTLTFFLVEIPPAKGDDRRALILNLRFTLRGNWEEKKKKNQGGRSDSQQYILTTACQALSSLSLLRKMKINLYFKVQGEFQIF